MFYCSERLLTIILSEVFIYFYFYLGFASQLLLDFLKFNSKLNIESCMIVGFILCYKSGIFPSEGVRFGSFLPRS